MTELFNLNPETFFEEWESNKTNTFLFIVFLFLLGTVLLAVFNNFPEFESSATVYLFLLVVVGFSGLFEVFTKEGNIFNVVNFISARPFIPLSVGLLLGAILFLQAGSIVSLPFSVVGQSDVFLILFVVISAPVVEEAFFRGVVQPTVTSVFSRFLGLNLFLSGFMAMFLQCGLFAFYHWRVLGGTVEAIAPSFAFAILATLGNQLFRSLGFSLGLHFINNLMVTVGG